MAFVPADGGIRFGQYVLLRRIARGGMAEVFLAQQRGLEGFDRRVAVKRILPHLADSPDFVKMFLGEAKLAAQLTHPNIVHIYDFGKVDNDYFIAMEYVEGVHAGQVFKMGERKADRMSPTLVARIGADAAAALHYAHELRHANGKLLGLVHRDVSPANLMVSYDGVVKLCDFGIAKAAAVTAELTNPGQVKGKYAYMSPEQTVAAPLDGRSDVFSLAIVMWELLAGKTIVGRGDAVDAMRAIRDGKLQPLAQAAPGTPEPLVAAITWALATKREQRATAAELATALEAFIKASPDLATPMHVGGWVRTRFPREATGPQQAIVFGAPGTPQTGAAPRTAAAPGTMAAPQTLASAEGTRIGPVTPPSMVIAASLVVEADETSETIALTKDEAHGRATVIDAVAQGASRSIDHQAATLIDDPGLRAAVDAALRKGEPPAADDSLDNETTLRSGGYARPFVPNAGAVPTMEVKIPRRNTPTGIEATLGVRRRIPRQVVTLGALFGLGLVSFAIALCARSSPSGAPADAGARIDAPAQVAIADAAVIEPGIEIAADAPVAPPIDAGRAPTIPPDARSARPTAYLEVRTKPGKAIVKVGDQTRNAPAQFALPAGKYRILAELDGWRDERRTVVLVEGLKFVQEIAFDKRAPATNRPRTGKLTVRTEPWADVYIGSRKIGQAPFADFEYPAGTYTLIFRNPAHKTMRRKVTIVGGRTTKVGPITLPP